jgi:hypothetical protein
MVQVRKATLLGYRADRHVGAGQQRFGSGATEAFQCRACTDPELRLEEPIEIAA